MTLPLSGLMSASMINVELGRAGTDPFDINGTTERALAEVPSGEISFSDFYGKSNNPPPPPPVVKWKLYQNGILRGEVFDTAAQAIAAWSYYGAGPWHPGLINNIPINVTLAGAPPQTAMQTTPNITYNVLNASNVIQSTPNSPNGAAPYWSNSVPGYKLNLVSNGNTTGGVLTLPVLSLVPI